jgi:hypothetical protein
MNMSGLYIHIKVCDTENAVKYIPIIKKYNGSSIGEIKSRILTGYAVSYDWFTRSGVNDGTDSCKTFRLLIDKLVSAGAVLEFYKQFESVTSLISLQIIDNMIERKRIISEQTQLDIDRELGFHS